MLSILQTRYQRVEKALDTLLESITAYNPSITAADELAAADDSVDDALDDLAVHHANYARILSLRAQSAALDEQIKSTLSNLVEARKTLKAINLPTHTSGLLQAKTTSADRQVRVDELLSYAKFISKTTVPPTRREDGPALATENGTADQAVSSAEHAPTSAVGQALQIGVKTEPTTPNPETTNGETGERDAEGVEAAAEQSNTMQRALPPEIRGQFIPWPSQEQMKMGGLGAVQAAVERGVDPASMADTGGTSETVGRQLESSKGSEGQGDGPAPTGAARPMSGIIATSIPRPKEEDEFDPDEM